MGSKTKIIIVGEYGLRFDQRAQGEESPYWNGTILKGGVLKGGASAGIVPLIPVGYFKNDGRGGMTIIQPSTIEADFRKMVDDTGIVLEWSERADIVIVYAEMLGYDRRVKALQGTYGLRDLVETYAKEFGQQKEAAPAAL
jgi:hypothetical protein